MKKVLFIDRDGTLIREPEDEQIDSFEKLEFLPTVFQGLGRIARELDFELVMVTNQDGLGTPSFTEESFWPVHELMLKTLAGEGIVFHEVLIDRTFPEEKAATRKPGTGMLEHYMNGKVDLEASFVIGDRVSDLELARNMGCRSIMIHEQPHKDAALTTLDWNQVFKFLQSRSRTASIRRKTHETDVFVTLNLDGQGQSQIETGIRFFDHMLDQVARHGGIDLEVKVKGDLDIDEHHTIEDTALALGSAFREALGSKRGIRRYGFLLPMDDSLAQVAIDFGGRPWLEWSATFTREKIGDMPTEMFRHFFKSFSDNARCNLNVAATGENEHHQIEAIFKAFAKALSMAISRTGNSEIPSTKGSL